MALSDACSEFLRPQASERFKTMLSKLGKSAYEVAIKIISDIGSATVKKMLGL
jgi:hypothetical protein